MVKYLLQHWHFYQPRRYKKRIDWNSIINKECYKPNAEKGNLNFVSFNVGPTLLQWLEKNDKKTLDLIIKQDCGQALAMPFSHRIMPLIRHDEDLKTQIIWGQKYFEAYFGRKAEGMWLPETATNKRVCRALAEHGIKYTIGASWQKQGNKDTTRPYKINLGKGLDLIYFFYHPFSAEVAFQEWTTQNADTTAQHINGFMRDEEMLLLAWDGELIGHHRKNADLWAEYFPKAAKKINGLKFLTIKDYLANHKVDSYTSIVENSSWSCLCGIERWRKGCGCLGRDENGREFAKSFQEPMLKALESLEDNVHEIFVEEGSKYFKDVWEARNNFIDVQLGLLSIKQFFDRHLKKPLTTHSFLTHLLKAEYYAQLMFTSCGWFFANMDIEAEYNIIDAARVINLAKKAVGKDLEPCVKHLKDAYNWKTKVTAEQLLKKYLK